MRRRLAAASLSALLLIATTACGSGSSDSTSSDSGGLDRLSVTGEFGKEPKVTMNGMDVTKAESEVLVKGDGKALSDGSAVLCRYVVVNGKTGETVESNYKDNEPTRLDLGQLQPAFKDALTGQAIGSRVALALPVTEMYGSQGAPQAGLSADDDVVLVLDLVKAAKPLPDGPRGSTVTPPADAPVVRTDEDGDVTGFDFSSAPAQAPKDLQVIPLVKGKGPAVKEGDAVTVNYFGAVWGNGGQPFDQSYTANPVTFTLTKGGLIEGWVEGLQGVKEGSRVMLVVPPDKGYGAKGSGEQIPPNSTLVFVIDVLGVNL